MLILYKYNIQDYFYTILNVHDCLTGMKFYREDSINYEKINQKTKIQICMLIHLIS